MGLCLDVNVFIGKSVRICCTWLFAHLSAAVHPPEFLGLWTLCLNCPSSLQKGSNFILLHKPKKVHGPGQSKEPKKSYPWEAFIKFGSWQINLLDAVIYCEIFKVSPPSLGVPQWLVACTPLAEQCTSDKCLK